MSRKSRISWKQWKRGLFIAILTGLFTGAVGYVAGASLKAAFAVFIVCVGKDGLLYLQQHPIDTVKDTKPPWRLPLAPFLCLAWLCLTGCARLVSHQVRTDCDGARTESWLRITTFGSAESSLAKARASTTEKTQGLTLSGFDQQTSDSNAVSMASEVVGAAVRAAIKP